MEGLCSALPTSAPKSSRACWSSASSFELCIATNHVKLGEPSLGCQASMQSNCQKQRQKVGVTLGLVLRLLAR
eukprot:scaffold1439_cov282-Pinguiococcus_pyrenoidosus.AAC.9